MQLNLSNEPVKDTDETSWDYKGADAKYNNHGIHDYPARMMPQIAHRLIKEYGSDKNIILDPFSGSGTTLLEAKLSLNFDIAYGIDINPLARLMAKVKTTPLDCKLIDKEYHKIIEKYHNYKKEDIEIPDFFNIEFWFKDYVIFDLAKLKKAILEIDDNNIQDFFKIIFSAIIIKVSNTRNSEFKLYKMSEKNLKGFFPDVLKEFADTYKTNHVKMLEFNQKHNNCNIVILDEDSRKKTSIPDNSVDLIVTSLPYGDSITTVAYGQFSRLSLQWLDFDKKIISSIDKTSLGGIQKVKFLTLFLKHHL